MAMETTFPEIAQEDATYGTQIARITEITCYGPPNHESHSLFCVARPSPNSF
jgi:hypothetical protein